MLQPRPQPDHPTSRNPTHAGQPPRPLHHRTRHLPIQPDPNVPPHPQKRIINRKNQKTVEKIRKGEYTKNLVGIKWTEFVE